MTLLSLLMACVGTSPAPETAPKAPGPAPSVKPVAIEVVPESIRWDASSGALSVEAHLGGTGLAARETPIHVGVTVVTKSGREVDLLVNSLFPGSFDESVWFSAELTEPPAQVLIGAWGRKIEPCDVDRPGCAQFGFVLDDSLAAFPRDLYRKGTRQRLLPASVPVVLPKGEAGAAFREVATTYVAMFGSSLVERAKPEEAPTGPGVWVADPTDLDLGGHVAAVADLPLKVRPGLGVTLLVNPR